MYNEGHWKHDYKEGRGDVLFDTKIKDETGNSIFIKRKSFKDYLNEYFFSCLEVFYLTENMGCLPFAGGWAEQPAEITAVINLFRIERSIWDKEQMEKESKS
ncbi:MAG: hypothetical protein ACTTHG_02875 [Treponemataceae bacterium]